MIEYKEEKKRLFFMGSELVSLYVKYPQMGDREEINSFFYTLASNGILWATQELFELAKNEYEVARQRGDSPKKPYRYTLQMLAEEDKDKDCYRISLAAALCRGREEADRYEEKFIFDAASGLIKRKR